MKAEHERAQKSTHVALNASSGFSFLIDHRQSSFRTSFRSSARLYSDQLLLPADFRTGRDARAPVGDRVAMFYQRRVTETFRC